MTKAKTKKIPKSFLGRATKMLGAGASILGREVGAVITSKMKEHPELAKIQTRIKQAQDLVTALGSLKGAAMKAGQLISLEFSDLLPPEVVDVLRTLHDSASHMPFTDVKKILQKQLGSERLQEIKNLSEEPIASASIGQVHSAEIDGKQVVLKVQYPGVAKSIDTDLAALKKILSAVLLVRSKNIQLDGVFEELSEGLKLEVDYVQEARFVLQYRKAFAHLPQFIIPQVYTAFTTKRVLTLSFEKGMRLNDWLKSIKKNAQREELAELVLSLLFHEIFELGVVQTDPNYGNFLVRVEGGRLSLVILDFGAVRTYDKAFRAKVRHLLAVTMQGDKKMMLKLAIDFKLLDERETEEVRAKFFKMMELVVYMFAKENQPFDFSDGVYIKEIREAAVSFANSVHHTSPAKHMIFLNRKLGGMFHLLKDAGVKVDVSRFWDRVQALDLRD